MPMSFSESRSDNSHAGTAIRSGSARRFPLGLYGLGRAVVGVAWFCRGPLMDRLRTRVTLANEAPTVEAVDDMIRKAANPARALEAAWRRGGIVHRQVAIGSLRKVFPASQPLPPAFESILLAATLDRDLKTRKSALGLLRERQHPAHLPMAAAQLQDVDPEVRLLGLNHLKYAASSVGLPLAAARLEDPDPTVLGFAVKLLERWSGETFGAKLADTIPIQNENPGLPEFRAEGLARILAAAARARAWWVEHASEFPPPNVPIPDAALAALTPVVAPDFELPTLTGGESGSLPCGAGSWSSIFGQPGVPPAWARWPRWRRCTENFKTAF